ncbi:class I SAM-dependent methyltransferase [soil metagenome]
MSREQGGADQAAHQSGAALPEWIGADYAANTAHHRVFDDRFLAPLQLRGDERILDLGCGSGDFTAKVADLVPDGVVVGLDPSASLLAEARSIARPNQRFILGPAQELTALLAASAGTDNPQATAVAPFDVIISRAAMHWLPAPDHATVLAAASRAIVPGGQLRLEMGGYGNIAQVRPILDEISSSLGGPVQPWTFQGAGWYMAQLEQAGFVPDQVQTVAQHRSFDRESLIGWFTSQVAMAYEHQMDAATARQFRERALDRVDDMRYFDGSYDQVFVRLEVLAHRR